MPAVGDQHRGGPSAITMPNAPALIARNPFGETPQRQNEYTPEESATLQARLDKKLGPEYISSRPGAAGQKVHYLAADKCINLANEVFGFNGWSSSIQNIGIDFVEESPNTGRVNIGLSVIMRVTLKDGAYHEDIGYGHIDNCKGKAAAFEKAKKEATTDALKRALRNFGNVLGNCIYDKDYVSKVVKVKTLPTKLDIDGLHRHPDFAPIKKEPLQPKPRPEDDDLPPRPTILGNSNSSAGNSAYDFDGEFGSDVFDEADFSVGPGGNPDEVVIESDMQRRQQPPTPVGRPNGPQRPFNNNAGPHGRPAPSVVTPSKPERPIAQAPGARHVSVPPAANGRQYPPVTQDQYANQRRSLPPQDVQKGFQNGNQIPPGQHSQSMPPPGTPGVDGQRPAPVGFFSARGADVLRDNPHGAAAAFDPHAESPSIRKTAGVDHSKSVAISKPMLAGASLATNPSRDFINPSAEMHRKIGAPGGSAVGSPMNRAPSTSSYRPLTRPNIDPRSAASNSAANRGGFGPPNLNGKRPPLSDVTNASAPGSSGPAPITSANDPKRVKFDAALPPAQQQQQQHPQQD
ncbi:hypothetical protein ARAM_002616 [Aspergillus rambellii]|uniref:RAD52 homolog n=1 Tax=Aspergillus rambellii TaxID=308745 RepID=A0A0F8V5B2_9EURO|nr:hypothetical protein ARAM_002616 [Aspergillus rambellii]